MAARRRRKDAGVPSITSARRALAEDQHDRTVRYLVAMGIRAVCLVLAVLTPSPWWWVFVAGAVVLPYVAVIIANAGREREEEPGTYFAPQPGPPQLEAGRRPLPYDPETEYLR